MMLGSFLFRSRRCLVNSVGQISDHLSVLGCSANDTNSTIKRRYIKLVRALHPDRLMHLSASDARVIDASTRMSTLNHAWTSLKLQIPDLASVSIADPPSLSPKSVKKTRRWSELAVDRAHRASIAATRAKEPNLRLNVLDLLNDLRSHNESDTGSTSHPPPSSTRDALLRSFEKPISVYVSIRAYPSQDQRLHRIIVECGEASDCSAVERLLRSVRVPNPDYAWRTLFVRMRTAPRCWATLPAPASICVNALRAMVASMPKQLVTIGGLDAVLAQIQENAMPS